MFLFRFVNVEFENRRGTLLLENPQGEELTSHNSALEERVKSVFKLASNVRLSSNNKGLIVVTQA